MCHLLQFVDPLSLENTSTYLWNQNIGAVDLYHANYALAEICYKQYNHIHSQIVNHVCSVTGCELFISPV